jgi:hypothetical protein
MRGASRGGISAPVRIAASPRAASGEVLHALWGCAAEVQTAPIALGLGRNRMTSADEFDGCAVADD